MNRTQFHAQVLELIRRTSAFLPADVSNVLELHRALEQAGSKADLALDLVARNIVLAKQFSAPICQDTGTITFYAKTPVGFSIGLAGLTGTELVRTLGNTQGGLPFTVMIDRTGRIVHQKLGETSFDELAGWAASLT